MIFFLRLKPTPFLLILSLLSMGLVSGAAAAKFTIPSISREEALRQEGARLVLASGLDGSQQDPAPAICHAAYTDQDLLLLFQLRGEGREVSEEAPRDDVSMFEHPAAEVFFSPGAKTPDAYYHIAAGAGGGVFDEFVTAGGWERDPAWDSGVEAEWMEAPEQGQWSVLLRVPLGIMRRETPIAQPAAQLSTEFRIQLAATAAPRPGELMPVTWSKTFGGFHSPGEFGTMAWQGPPPTFPASMNMDLKQDQFEGQLAARVEGKEGSYVAEAFLRRVRVEPLQMPLFRANVSPGLPATHAISLGKAANARFVVGRLYTKQGAMIDQVQMDWMLSEGEPVSPLSERFIDRLELTFRSFPNRPISLATITPQGSGEPVWTGKPEDGVSEEEIDTSAWSTGLYEVSWETESGELGDILVRRLPDDFPMPEPGFAFWGYDPDEQLLAEYRAFSEQLGEGAGLTGLIYGGSVDPAAGAISAINLEPLRRWQEALPSASMHVMIDGAGSFDQVSDEDVEAIAQRIVDELKGAEEVAGVHFDLEPYRASQVRLTRALNRRGWDKAISMATGLALTIPDRQWAGADFMVAMNYDLGRTPEEFRQRAAPNAEAFAEAAARNQIPLFIGIPVIATHNEYAFAVEKATGEITSGSESDTMVPYVVEALDICRRIAKDARLSEYFYGPALWGALARGHGVGLGETQYLPSTMDPESWTLLLDYHGNSQE